MTKITDLTIETDKPVVATTEYESLVNEANTLVCSFNGQSLRFYWELGRIIHNLCNNSPKYGNKTIETFAEDLKKTNSTIQLEKSSLYNAKKFYSLINEKLLISSIQAKIPWRGMVDLLADSVTDNQRLSLIQGAAAGEYTQGDIKTKLDKIKNRLDDKDNKKSSIKDKEDKEDKEPVISSPPMVTSKIDTSHAGRVKGIGELLGAVMVKVEDFGKSVEIMLEETTKDKQIEVIKEQVAIAEDNFNLLTIRWKKEIDRANEALNKTVVIKKK